MFILKILFAPVSLALSLFTWDRCRCMSTTNTRELMNEGDTPPIGIVLCADKGDSVVKYTLPEDNHQIFASKYFTYLPTEDELKRELRLDDFHKLEE